LNFRTQKKGAFIVKNQAIAWVVILFSTQLLSCAPQSTIDAGRANVEKPVTCATAEADIRALENEKVHAAQQLAAGVSAIVPIGLVANLAEGTEGSQLKMAIGDYNTMLDDRIIEIKMECGML
jgi:hypothetical protein